jgi:ABC-type Fe3+/spermidine/putrescine transport system ATPase subunit
MLATDPRVLLFDEPLSALDRNLRDTLKYAILALQRRTKKTAIYVTHDQSEAFAISDRVFVMNQGRVEQSGTQLDIYLRPASEFVASFVGDNNAIRGEVTTIEEDPVGGRMALVRSNGLLLRAHDPQGLQPGERVLAFVRPEHVEVVDGTAELEGPNVATGSIEQVVFEGATVRLTLDADGTPLRVSVGGLERLTLLESGQRRLRVRLRQVSLVRAGDAV